MIRGHGWTRRRMLGRGAAAAGLAGGALAALSGGRRAEAKAAPQPQSTVVELTFMPWWIYWTKAGRAVLQEGVSRFAAENPGLRLTALPGPQGGGASTSTVVTDIITGSGPDVIADCCGALVTYVQAGAFADLQPLLKESNVPLSTWSKGQVQALATASGQWALPVYNGPVVYACRQDLLDQLGLPYPDPSWTYEEAASLWRSCAGSFQSAGKTQQRVGCNFWWYSTSWYAQGYLFRGFGGAPMDATRTKALFTDPGALAAGNWVYPLLWEKVLGPASGSITAGTAVFETAGGWSIPEAAIKWGNTFKWQYYPSPMYPNGRATFSNNDFWGLNANSKHPNEAWTALQWLAAGHTWQRFCMQATLLAPSAVALYSEFVAQLEAVAPPLKNRGLQWFQDAALGGYGYAEEFFKYQPTQAISLIGNILSQVYDQKLTVPAGFAQVVQQIDALEAGGKSEAAAAAAASASFPSTGPSMAAQVAGI